MATCGDDLAFNHPDDRHASPRQALVLTRGRFLTVIASAMGVSVISQTLAFARQLLVAAFFGVSRELDIYLIVYAIATMVVFTFGVIFDSVAVPRMVQLRERDGEAAFRALAAAVFQLSCAIGVVVSALLPAVVPLLAPIVATGFSADERSELAKLAWYFLPWALLCLPYYAVAAQHKGRRNFNRVFAAEIAIGVASIVALATWHGDIRALPIAYAAGYAVGFAALLPKASLTRGAISGNPGAFRAVIRNVSELFLANQTGNATSLVDRHYQSLIPAGGIAAVNYSAQLVSGLSTLLTFREVFIVPLSEVDRRTEKLERLLIGLALLVVPIAAFVSCFAREAVSILFERGRFDAAAAGLTADVLRVYALVLIPSVMATPLFRMFQVMDRIGYTHLVYLASAGFLGAFGFLFIRALDLGAPGIAWMVLGNSIAGLVLVTYLVARNGLMVSARRIGWYFLFAAAVASAASAGAMLSTVPFTTAWARMIIGGGVFFLVVGVAYVACRARLRWIIT